FNFIQGDPSLLAGIPTLARVAAWGGGFPIKVNGEVVGAIGVSGAPMVQNDIDCARAALALLPDAVPTERKGPTRWFTPTRARRRSSSRQTASASPIDASAHPAEWRSFYTKPSLG